MNKQIINFKFFLIILIFGFLSFFSYYFISLHDKNTKIVFCDVGQGDASYIRIKNQVDVLIDAGPDRKILTCLGKHMPFFDKQIELAIISHFQKDHFGGFLYLLDRYQFKTIILPPISTPSETLQNFINKLSKKKVSIKFSYANNEINIKNTKIVFFWPIDDFVSKKLLPLQNDVSQVLKTTVLDSNFFSFVFLFEVDNFKVLYTGDAPSSILNKISSIYQSNLKTNILKIPHHGSKNGLTKNFLKSVEPELAVISVGQKNPFGHPHQEILEILKAQGVKIRRTDIENDIVFKLSN